MKKRVVLKKGRLVATRRGKVVLHLADGLLKELKYFSKRIEIAGSIRRKEENPVDIDIVLIPKDKKKIVEFMSKKGKFLQGGEKRVSFSVRGVKVEIYFADKDDWGAMLMAYTGPSGESIGMRMVARKKGYLLNQYGLFVRGTKNRVAGKTENKIYQTLNHKFKKPEERGR